MTKLVGWAVVGLLLSTGVAAAQSSGPQKPKASQRTQMPAENEPAPRSDDGAGHSSSKDTRIDLSPPRGDAMMHPNSEIPADVTEMRPYDPHKAEKNIEIGDFYFKKKNFEAAASRYREALSWKPNDAVATFRLGQSLESLGQGADARQAYEEYLKILPNGPSAEYAKKAVERLPKPEDKKASLKINE
ncbi:MAG TPA: tetratricopeptide repeat protein [Clostridia bacterium]|nr:tetratricopeptide repeat protein [Clostridia bacterium]